MCGLSPPAAFHLFYKQFSSLVERGKIYHRKWGEKYPQHPLSSHNQTNQSNWFARFVKISTNQCRRVRSRPCYLHESKQRFFSLSSSLRDSLSPLHGSLSLLRRKISRKPLGPGYYLQYNCLFLSRLKFAVCIFILTDLEIPFALSKFSTTYILRLIWE